MSADVYIFCSMCDANPTLQINTAVQRPKAVSAYFTSNQILPFVFAEQYKCILFSIRTMKNHGRRSVDFVKWIGYIKVMTCIRVIERDNCAKSSQ